MHVRELMVIMGECGEQLLNILDEVEKFGKRTFIITQLVKFKMQWFKAVQRTEPSKQPH